MTSRRTIQISPHEVVAVPEGLTDEQVQEIQSSFEVIDVNKDGRLSKNELTKAAAVLGLNPTDDDITEMMKSVDVNSDGFISFKEYITMMAENYKDIDMEAERMKAAFHLLDKNNDGFVTLKELQAALCHKNSDITVEEVEQFFNEIDADGDGKIDYEEFIESTLCNTMF